MEQTTKVYKTFENEAEAEIILESEACANLQQANISKISQVEFTTAMILVVVFNAKIQLFAARRHTPGAALRLLILLKELARMYYANGEYYEKRAIELNDPALILDLGYKYYKPRKATNKLPIEVRNTDVIGELFGLPKLVDGTRFYIFESTKMDSDEAPKESIVGTAKGQTMTGFTSGDLLMFTSQPVFLNGSKGEKTAGFIIRVR